MTIGAQGIGGRIAGGPGSVRERRVASRLARVAVLALAVNALAASPASACAPDDAAETLRQRLADRVAAWHARADAPGLSVAVVLGEEAPITLVAGTRSRTLADHPRPDGAAPAGEEPIAPADRFLAGSTGKTFVAATALALAAEGALDLDARAAAILDEPAWLLEIPNGGEVTIRQLLSHRSGVPRYVLDPALWSALLADPDREWTPEECLGRLAGAAPLSEPGTAFAYADSNYLIVGRALEAADGRPIREQVRARFLEPLALDGIVPQDSRSIGSLVQGHPVMTRAFGVPERMLDEDGRLPLHPGFEGCGGGYASTPVDLARWARALFSGAAIGADALARMLHDAGEARELGPGARYGLGVIVRDTAVGELLGHDGVFPGYLTAMGYVPALDLGVAAQWNGDGSPGGPPHRLLVELAEIVGEFAGR